MVRTLLSLRLLSASEPEKQQRYTCTLLRLSTTRYDGVDEYLVRVGRVVYAELQVQHRGAQIVSHVLTMSMTML